jgi:hypothetical protein
VAIVECVIACFSNHLSQGYHDLRILVDKRFKISKGVEVKLSLEFKFRKLRGNLWRLRASEALRKSSELPSLQSKHSVLTEEQLKGIQHLSGIFFHLGLIHRSPFTAWSTSQTYFHRAPLSLPFSPDGDRIALPSPPRHRCRFPRRR